MACVERSASSHSGIPIALFDVKKSNMSTLIIINDAPYGTEKAYNALRMAMTLQSEHSDVEVRIFLLADAVGCALPNQRTPRGYYNIERMLKSVIGNGGKVKACGGCSEARGIAEFSLIEGVEISTMKEFAQWAVDATKTLSF
jgi:uncharacterized protein involved in oxidation of intracellular sulfur